MSKICTACNGTGRVTTKREPLPPIRRHGPPAVMKYTTKPCGFCGGRKYVPSPTGGERWPCSVCHGKGLKPARCSCNFDPKTEKYQAGDYVQIRYDMPMYGTGMAGRIERVEGLHRDGSGYLLTNHNCIRFCDHDLRKAKPRPGGSDAKGKE